MEKKCLFGLLIIKKQPSHRPCIIFVYMHGISALLPSLYFYICIGTCLLTLPSFVSFLFSLSFSATKEELERSFNVSSNITGHSSPSLALFTTPTTPSRISEQSSRPAGHNVSNPFTRAIVADSKQLILSLSLFLSFYLTLLFVSHSLIMFTNQMI